MLKINSDRTEKNVFMESFWLYKAKEIISEHENRLLEYSNWCEEKRVKLNK